MALAQTIVEQNEKNCNGMIKLLKNLDPQINMRVDYVMKHASLSKPEALEYIVTDNPMLWAKVYLDWESRDYQKPIVTEAKRSRRLVLRLGRRLGKTDVMCVMILWYAYTQYNKGENDQYDIIIATPYENQIDLVFKRVLQLLNSSPLLLGLVTKNVQHHLVLTINGVDSHIQGFTAGANNASAGANNTRGQRADVLFLDECDYIGSNQISNVLQICNEAPERIKVICASTPSGKHEEYYRWCMNASKKYYVSSQDIQSNEFNGYKVDELPKKDGNGWVQIYAPSNVNKELLKLNPDTGQTYLEDLRDEFSEMRYAQEVMAEFGEEEMGVYQHKFIELAIAEGRRLGWKYLNKWDDEERKTYLRKTQGRCIRCLGVDWDKYAAGTTLVCMEYDPFHKDETGRSIPLFKVLFREEVPRSEFTYTNAENKIIELNREYKFDWIAVDRGYGETQVEELHKYGMLYPRTKLQDKVIGIQFAEKIEVMDPYTKKKDKKPVKPFMVNNSVSLFEKCKIVLDPSDKVLIEQLEEYRIKGISAAGNPIFTDENEHAIDAMNLALLMFEQKYGTLLKKVYSVKPVLIDMSDKRDMGVASREIKAEDITQVIGTSIKGGPFAPSSTKGIIGITNIRKSGQVRRSENMFRRSSWG